MTKVNYDKEYTAPKEQSAYIKNSPLEEGLNEVDRFGFRTFLEIVKSETYKEY